MIVNPPFSKNVCPLLSNWVICYVENCLVILVECDGTSIPSLGSKGLPQGPHHFVVVLHRKFSRPA